MTVLSSLRTALRRGGLRLVRLWRAAPWLRVVLAGTAAVLAVALVLLGAREVVRDPLGPSAVTQGRPVAADTRAQAQPRADAAPVDAAQNVVPLQAGFVPWSLTASFDGTRYALGEGVCAGSACPALARTRDGGRTWARLHFFGSSDTSAASGESRPQVQPDGALSDVRFVSATTGYVFGGDLWVTRDAGRTFTQVAHPGATVLDVAVWKGRPIALTATGCIQGVCTGRVEVSRIGGGDAPALAPTLGAATPTAPLRAARLVTGGDRLVVVARGEVGSSGDSPGSWRLSNGALTPLNPGAACNARPLDAAAVAPAGGAVIGLCDEVVAARTTSYTTVRSSDGGATWVVIGSGNLALPTQGRVSLAVTDGDHLVAASGGPREAPDGTTRTSKATALMHSDDAGRTWWPASGLEPLPAGGFDALHVDGARRLIATTRTGTDVWRSRDAGSTWSRAPLVGAR